jgi:site-specific DNA recombinase
MLKPPQHAAIYCRLSYAPDGSVEKVERQEADCRRLADQLAWPVSEQHVYSDNSRSAWQRNRKRPAWDAMLAAIDAGQVDGIIVYHGDRLVRQPFDLELLLNLANDRHLQLASVTGTRDLQNEDDKYLLRIEAAGFCRASADASRRINRGYRAKVERGEALGGGKRPFGYGVDTGRKGRTGKPIYDTSQIVPEEAEVLREAVRWLLQGHTVYSVLTWLNERSRTTQGNRWNGVNLHHLLTSPRIAGMMRYKGQLMPGNWPAIISPEDWEGIAEMYSRSSAITPYQGRERRYLLSGIAVCYKCGTGLYTKPTGGRNRKTSRIYYCRNTECGDRVGRNLEHLDRYVEGAVLARLQDPGLLEEVLQPDPGLGAEIAALETRKAAALQTLRTLVDHPDVSPEVIAESLAGFDQRIAELRARQAATARQRLLARMAGITREAWEATPLDVRALTVRALYRVVVLSATWRGPGFDTASVRLERVEA